MEEWDSDYDVEIYELEQAKTVRFMQGLIIGILGTLILTYSLLFGLGVLA